MTASVLNENPPKLSLFQSIFERASDGILVVDPEGYVVLCNASVEQMFQRPRQEFQGNLFGYPVVAGKSTELDILRKDGSLAVAEMRVSEASFANEQVCIAMLRDITERKQAEAELKRSHVELEQFSYAISHDMRQPLRMVTSYMQLLEGELAGQLDDGQREYFDFAIEGAQRLDRMLSGLLEYSRVGRICEPPEWVESRAILDDVLLILQPAMAEAQARLSVTGEWPCVFVSRDEVLRLLQNLIGNAFKFRVAERQPEIIVSSETVGKEWHVAVADNGVGVIPGQTDRLFKVFQRLQRRAVYEGTGIGLALCRKIAERHGGRIWVESPGAGQGSKFCVTLPLDGRDFPLN